MTRFDEGRLRRALQHEQALRRLAAGLLRDPADADDAAQHALLQEASGRRREDTGLWPFLCKALRHRASNLRKLAARRRTHEHAASRSHVGPPVDELLAREQLRRRIADAVLELDEPYRTTVWLRWFEGLTTAAVAAHEGVPVATVRTRLQRAYERLRRRLDADYGDRRWAALVGLPGGATATAFLLPPVFSLMSKKIVVTVAAAVLLAGALALPWVGSPSLPANANGAAPSLASAALPANESPPQIEPAPSERTMAPAVPRAVHQPPLLRIVHADGRPAAGIEVRWWSAGDRPGWTVPLDPTKVRPSWPTGMGPGRWTDPWYRSELHSGSDGTVAIPADPTPVAVSCLLADGLYFSTAWSLGQASVALPALAPIDIAMRGGHPSSRWRGGCFGAWREQDGEPNHGYMCENVTTGSGPGIVRWDRIPFRGEGNQGTQLTVLAGHQCAVEVEGTGFEIEPCTAVVTAPAAVMFRCTERIPQVHVQVVEADGRPSLRDGRVWLCGERLCDREELEAGRASLNRRGEDGQATLRCLLVDGRLLTAELPSSPAAGDVNVVLSCAKALEPLRVHVDGGIAAPPAALWIDVDGVGHGLSSAPQDLMFPTTAGTFVVVDRELLVNCLPPAWRSGLLWTQDGRFARFPRQGDARVAVAEFLPLASPRTVNLPALSRDTGELPIWSAVLELECPAAAGTVEWIQLRRFRRLVLDDHPEPLVVWSDLRLPIGWRVRLTIAGAKEGQPPVVLRQQLL